MPTAAPTRHTDAHDPSLLPSHRQRQPQHHRHHAGDGGAARHVAQTRRPDDLAAIGADIGQRVNDVWVQCTGQDAELRRQKPLGEIHLQNAEHGSRERSTRRLPRGTRVNLRSLRTARAIQNAGAAMQI